MICKVKITSLFKCSLERAFKTPMLCDVSKVHTGYGLMPAVTKCSEDENWGQPGSSKNIFVAKSFTQRGGFASIDHIIERIENSYWKIAVTDFQSWMLGFYKFEGEWETSQFDKNNVLVEYSYTMYSDNLQLYPFCWLFTNLFWKKYMRKVIENVRSMAYNNEPYLYD